MRAPQTLILVLAAFLAVPLATATPRPAADPLPGLAQPADEEIVKEFKKYFKKYKDTPTRVEALMALDGVQDAGVVKVLLPVLKDKEPEVVRAAVRILSQFTEPEPITAVVEALADGKNEQIRTGLLTAVTDGKYAGATEACIECLEERSWELRRRAVIALAALGAPEAADAILPLCEDNEVAVRCAALDGLAALGSPSVIDPAIADLEHDVWQVRASAIAALAKVRDRRSIDPLVQRMQLEEGRLVADIGAALEEITGRTFGNRVEGWVGFWNTYKDRFQIPSDEELAKLKEARAKSAEKYDQAIESLETAVELSGGNSFMVAELVYGLGVAGRTSDAQQRLAEIDPGGGYVSPSSWAVAHLGLGDRDQALTWLERAVEDHSSLVVWMKVEPMFDPVRDDPRFEALLKTVGLS